MTLSKSRSAPGERLLAAIETATGSGAFELDDRLRVEEVHERADRAFSTATLSVRVDDTFDSGEARRRYHPDLRVLVMTDEPEIVDRVFLFEGYVPVQAYRWDGRIGKEEERYVIEAEHVFERLSRDVEAMVYGRRVRDGEIEDGLVSKPDLWAGGSHLITALPCVFNPDGVANRAKTPLVIADRGASRLIHPFTWDGDPIASKWTYASALRYLIWFHLKREGPAGAGNIWSATDDVAAATTPPNNRLARALMLEPVSLVCEATSLVEALSLWSAASGIHVTAETVNHAGRPVTQLRIWSPEDGPVRHLYLAAGGHHPDGTPRYDTTGRPVRRILRDNNAYRGELRWNLKDMGNTPLVIGDVKRFEMTVPLMPGWPPREHLDDVAVENREHAKGQSLTPGMVLLLGDDTRNHAYFRRYHRQGYEFALNADVGRLWVLNEDGRFGEAIYNRNPPFDDYRPFAFSSVFGDEAPSWGRWMRRPRVLLPTLSASSSGQSLGVWVEVSFDAGATWERQSGGVKVLQDRVGIYFDCENPTEIAPAGADPADQNMWFAIIDQVFRVRVTAVIESDERIIATSGAGRHASPTTQTYAQLVYRPKSFQYVTREHTTNVLIDSTGQTDKARDDTQAAADLARQVARNLQNHTVRAVPVIPWIETGYGPGDRIDEIRGRHVRFATTAGGEPRCPSVLCRRIRMRDGRYETELTIGVSQAGV